MLHVYGGSPPVQPSTPYKELPRPHKTTHPRLCAYPDLSYSETTSTETIIAGVAPVKMYYEGSEMSYGAENDCKCGANCSCSSCGCHK
ncbi:metallothionein 2B [Prunus dulcis]|uniref:Metallothionein-like protein n=1 Tax=Prunus dulcis TaxID=3755 RepID=A0A4Y1RLN2_PRUDU|nr:metallothionein 2B [Prunus dulcis]